MGLLDRKKLLSKEDLKVERVDLGDDEFVYVRMMTAHERDAFEQSLMTSTEDEKTGEIRYERSLEDFRAKLAVLTICDEEGKNILEPGDYPALSRSISAKKMEKIITIAQRLNKISEEDKKVLLKNSEGGQSAASISDSPGS